MAASQQRLKTILLSASLSLLALPAFADDGIAFFEQRVRPVLEEHCYGCHSQKAEKLKGNLYLDSQAGWQKGGDSGAPAIIPGNPEASLLLRTVRHIEADLEMPPKKPKLPDRVIGDLRQWIAMGAPDPRTGTVLESKRADKSWWSLQPLAASFKHGNIDEFIRDKLTEKGLALSPRAEPRDLIRRVTYDLHGLPPAPEEVEKFVTASRTDADAAYLALIERLLASPRYGEQWGRHWLDVIRFGESNGFERNFVINDLWPFRDYIIRSFNEDKPFDRLIIEHIAGDVVGRDDPAVEVGTAFLVAGPYDDVGNQDPVAQANIRAATLDDMITATGSAFLGLTVNCARCHNHKFDPIPSEDYYRLRAAFEGVSHGRRVLATKAERSAFAEATKPLNQELGRLNDDIAALEKAIESKAREAIKKLELPRPKIDPQLVEESFAPVEARFVRLVMSANTSNPSSAAGSGRLTEFEVWTAGDQPRNVALARHGGVAEGARSAVAEDFPDAYGPQTCIDGQFGEQWFIGSPAELTITLAKLEIINRVTFSNAKGKGLMDKAQGATPCEYEVRVSTDGKNWSTVASGADREPWSEAHGIARVRASVTTAEEEAALSALKRQQREVQMKLDAVPKLREAWAGNFTQPKSPTFLHKGGDPMKPADAVAASSLSVLDQVTEPYTFPAEAPESERRLALARWIVTGNPLTARVLANRVWHYHFGAGIVDTPSDFGFLGSRPSHPELLDYLASRLVANRWQLKALHREILLSETYRQASRIQAGDANATKGLAADRQARLLWRFPPRRLSAEEIRDTLLTVSGRMKLEPMGGPGFRLYKFTQNNVCTYFPLDTHGPETYRRAVYHQNARASTTDLLTDFDLPDIAFAAPRRANTTSPLQALTLLNHNFTSDMAAAFAARCEAPTTAAAIGRAYRLAFARAPLPAEEAAAAALVSRHGLTALCRALLNASELLYLD
jgi:mono/diheme cytochrome c family protein